MRARQPPVDAPSASRAPAPGRRLGTTRTSNGGDEGTSDIRTEAKPGLSRNPRISSLLPSSRFLPCFFHAFHALRLLYYRGTSSLNTIFQEPFQSHNRISNENKFQEKISKVMKRSSFLLHFFDEYLSELAAATRRK